MIMVGGPSRSPVWPKIIADAACMPLKVFPDGIYAGAAGAAKIAGGIKWKN
jgi:sugar (pentulose or hexulose) kinase